MRLFLVFFSFTLAYAARSWREPLGFRPPAKVLGPDTHIVEKTFEQILEHFNSSDNRTWTQVERTTLTFSALLYKPAILQ